MPKKCDENYLDFRRRVMDSISPTFCAAKWYNATIWLDTGRTASCHHPPAHPISMSELEITHKALHNTRIKKEERRLMLDGKRPPDCNYCWRLEDVDPTNVSDRVFKTVIYTEQELSELKQLSPDADVDLKTLEVAFDNRCNFACVYCNPEFSTRWQQDCVRYGDYRMTSHLHVYDEFDPDGPYLSSFWKWWPTLLHSLQEFRITGGEPLLSPSFWKLLDETHWEEAPQMTLGINSNLGVHTTLIEKLIARLQHHPRLDFYTSGEAHGPYAEYIRDGLNYAQWISNIRMLTERLPLRSMNVMMTVNALALPGLIAFLDEMFELKKTYGRFFPVLTVNILRIPNFLSVNTLHPAIRQRYARELASWLNEHSGEEYIHAIERESLLRLIQYLERVDEVNSEDSLGRVFQERQLKSFLYEYDRRRSKNWNVVFGKGQELFLQRD